MGRTVPSFRIALAIEKEEWKPFRNALDKSDRKKFDEMFDIPKLYITACSNSVQLVPLHPILMSILFHHYKQLIECIEQIGHMSTEIKASQKVRGDTLLDYIYQNRDIHFKNGTKLFNYGDD
jgi:hypothetical protein